MKKYILMAAAASIAAAGLTGCKEDTQPRLDKPTEFVLNRPAMADQLYVMSPDNSIFFTVSQPDYGVGCMPSYQVEIAKAEDNFKNGVFSEENPDGYITLETTTTSARIEISGEMFSMAMCSLFGYTTETNFSSDPKPIYVRVHAWIPNADYSDIYSNVIELSAVQPYFAVKVADLMWLVGQPEGWTAPAPGYPEAGPWTLSETEPGSLVYEGTFTIPADQFQFRFYDQFSPDEPWDWYSIGAQDEDSPVAITMTDGAYQGNCFYDPTTKGAGKGSWQIEGWAGGDVKITVNLGNKTVRFEQVN